MKYRRASGILIFFTSCILFILYIYVNKTGNNIVENASQSMFSYSANDTYCPIPIFVDERINFEIKNNDCNYEYPDWIYSFKNHVVFNHTIFQQIGNFMCFFKEIKWNGDFQSIEDPSWNPLLNNTYIGNRILKILCKANGMFNYNEHYIFGFEENNHQSDLPNILVLGIDSLSRLAWKKFLPNSYNYLETQMESTSTIFKKVNVRGDGTTINILAILTGEEETELYESRRNEPGAKPVDNYPWIWKQLSKKDYITLYDDEDTEFGTFEYRLLGFQNQPTNYYGRTWRLIHKLQKKSKLCMNQKNNFQFQLDHIEQFYKTIISPKFAFVWSSYFSHNYNENVMKLDRYLFDFLNKINNPNGIYNNTILFLISDHGHRFNSRHHLRGKYEERLPFLAVNIPKVLNEKYPYLVKNMKLNENKLITLFDAHETLIDIINNFPSVNKNSNSTKNVSLFNSNMINRNCDDVKIPAHWCVCLKWLNIDINNENVINAVYYAIKLINSNTNEYRSVCHHLELAEILRANLISPSDHVVKFYKSDKDGRKPDLSDNTSVKNIYYRVVFKTKPGDAIFESTIKVIKTNGQIQYQTNLNEIDRNNRYANWVWCVNDKMRDVRKYCLCH